jgi:acyl carrier protein
MLARYGDRSPESVHETLGSLELTWLIAEFEQAYGIELDLDDQRLDAVRSVDDAAALLREAVQAAGAARR